MGRKNSTWRELLLGRNGKDRRTVASRRGLSRDGRSLRMEPLEKRELLSVTPAGYWELDETEGTTAFDTSGNGLNGTLVGGVQWTADGKLGGAIDLDGNNQYVEVADSSALDGTSQLTISTWVNADTLDGQARGIVSKRAGYNSQNAYSLFFHTGNRLHVYIDGAGDVFSSNTVFQTGRWYHVAVTYDGSLPEAERVKLYVDGKLDKVAAETSSTIPDYASNLTLGTLNAGYATSFDGKLDDVRIYNQTLSADAIAQQARQPVANWQLDETAGTSAADDSGNALTGTLMGGAQWTTEGQFGGAIDLDGNNQYVQVADSMALDNTSELTISTWVYADTLDGQARGIVSKRNAMNSQHAYSLFFYTGNKLHVYIDGANDIFASNTVFETGRWYHIAATYDGSLPEAERVKLYVDGVLDTVAAETSSVIANYASPLTLGTLNADYHASFDGRIDDTRIYNQALSAEAIQRVKLTPTVAITDVPATAEEGTAITLGSSIAYPDPEITYIYAWSVKRNGVAYLTGADASVAFTPDDDATYLVTLAVTDSAGHEGTATETVVVTNVAPTLSLTGDATVDEGSVFTLNLSATDPGDDTITQWDINWGDGNIITYEGNPSSVQHTYADGPNTYTITATATDEDGTYSTGIATQAGELDTSFGDGGVAAPRGWNYWAHGIAIQSDGKTIVVGGGTFSGDGEQHILRYNSDGTPDCAFGTTDVLTNFSASSVTIDSNHRIVVAGTIYDDGWVSSQFALVRYMADGSLDDSFGAGGIAVSGFSSQDSGYSVAVQGDGKIVVAGNTYNGINRECVLARFDTDGNLDATFGNDGKLTTDFLGSGYGRSMAIQSDGKIVVVGSSNSGSHYTPALARYNTDGSLDVDFGVDGKVTTDVHYRSVAIETDDKLVVVGYGNNGNNHDVAVARYDTDGSLDTTFGNDGELTTDLGGWDYGYSVAIQRDGKIVVVGATVGDEEGSSDFAVVRYDTSGNLDATFANEGKRILDLGGFDTGQHVAIQADGKIVIAGTACDQWYGVLRLHAETTQGGWTLNVLNVAPTVEIINVPTTPVEGTEINLTAAVTDPGTLDTFTYAWTVTKNGDAYTTGTDAGFSFTPDDNGTYVVSLTATDKDGGQGTASETIVVANVAPTVQITGVPASPIVGTAIALDSLVDDPGSLDALDTFTYAWSVTKDWVEFATGTETDFTFTPDGFAVYVVTLAVTDKDGGVGTATATIEIGGIAHWRFNETAGTTAYDASGNWLNGTLVGGVQWTADGKLGGAIDLDGNNQYVEVADSNLLDNTSQLTVSTWVYADTLDGQARGIVSKRNGMNSQHAYSLFFHTGNRLHVYIDGAGDVFSSNTVFQTGRWYHVAVTYDGSLPEAERVKLYVDGKLDKVAAETSSTIPDYASNLTLGTLNADYHASLDGKLDDTRIYNQALSADAIAEQARQPVAYWKLDETEGTSATDVSGNALTGTLVSGAQWTADGKVGGAIELNGNNQYVHVADSPALDATSQLTISTWVYADTLDGQARGIISKRVGYNNKNAYSLFFHTGNRLHVYIDGAGDVFSSNTVFQTGRWYHVAVTYDGSLPEAERVKLYVDGKLDKVAAETSSAIPNYASPLTLGSLNADYQASLDGRIDETRIYNQALSAEAIAEQARLPVAQWLLDETSGASAYDTSGNGLIGTLANGAQWTMDDTLGGVVELDGNDQYVQVADASVLDATSQLTISTWVYADTLDGQARGIVSKRNGMNSQHAYSLFFYTDNKLHVYIDGANDVFASSTVFETGQWYHVAVTYDGSLPEAERVKLYVDGVLDTVAAETSSAIPNYASPLTLGTLNAGYHASLDGRMDDTRVYNQAFDAEDIAALAVAPGAPLPPQAATNLAATVLSNTRVTLAWDDNAAGEYGYLIETSTDGETFSFAGWAPLDATSHTVTGLTADTHYFFRVVAYNAGGYTPSVAIEATTEANLPLTPADLEATTVGSNQVDLSWTVDPDSEQDGFRVEISTEPRDHTTQWRFDETGGTTAFDSSTSGLNGTLAGGAQWTTDGKSGGAIELDGNDQYVEIADNALLDGASELTISTWVYADTLDGQARGIVSKRAGYNSQHAYSLYFHTGNKLHVQIVGSNDVFASETVFQTGRWYHVAVTYNGNLPEDQRVKLYVDGRLDTVAAETSAAIPDYASNLTLGTLNAGYYASLDGKLDDTRIYRQALTADQIARQAQKPVAQWSLDETAGTAASDAAGNGLTGTLAGGAQWTTEGQSGGAIELNGNNQYVQVADSATLDGTSELTISTWVYADTLDGQARGIVSKRSGMNSQHAYSLFFHTDNKLHVYIDGAGDVFASDTVFETGRWYHIAVTYDGSLPEAQRVKLYVDGVLDTVAAETSSAIPNYASSLTLGTLNAGYYTSFDGRIDDTRIYRQALSAEAVASLAQPVAEPTWTLGDDGTSATVTGLAANTTYYFHVVATNTVGQSACSNEIEVLTTPAAPTELAATDVSMGSVTLAWTAGENGQYGFRVEQSTDGGASFTEIATAWDPEFVVDNLMPNTQYAFRVRAYNAAGHSEYTTAVEITTDAATTAPAAPTGLYASAVSGAAAISLTWTDNSDNEAGFIIQQSSNGSDFTDVATTDPNCTTWTVGNLLSGKQYSFRVRATNHMGDSADSNTAAATTASVASAPYVKLAAAAADSLVTGTSTTLSVFGVNTASGADYDTDNDSNLTYTWAATMLPPGATAPAFTVTDSDNGTNAAKNATVTFTSAGTYWLTVTLENTATNKSTTSSVAVTVAQTATIAEGVTISPASASLHAGETLQFTATGVDQFGNDLDASALTWTATAGDITPDGFYTAPEGSASVTVMVTNGSLSDSSTVTVTNAAPTIATAAAAVQVPATATAALSVLGADDAGESKLTYTWTCLVKPDGAADPTISVEGGENGASAARSATATFTSLGNYQFQVTITDGGGLSVTDSVAITVVQTLTTITLAPTTPSVALGGTQQFTATGYDQFEDLMAEQPTFYWSATAGRIDATGLYTAPSAAVPATVVVSSGGVVARADVSLTDPSPTTSARFGNTWLADWWVEALGSPDTREDRVEQASGTMAYALSTGFIVDPTATFELATPENSTDTVESSTTPTEYEWEVDGVVYTSIESTTSTLVVTKTLDAYGEWTYAEVFSSTYTVATTMAGEAFATVTGSYGYAFNASGGGDISAYTFAATVLAPVVGAVEEGSAVGAWTQTVGATDSITHTRNHATGERSGRRFGNGGTNMTFPSYTLDGYLYADNGHSDFDYDVHWVWDDVNGWTLSGTATTTWADSGSTSDSYTDTYDDVGDGWSYKETSGMTSSDQWSYSYTLNHAIQSDGTWQATSGRGGSSGSGSWTWSYDGKGNYWPVYLDEEIVGEFTDKGSDATTYAYKTAAWYEDGYWHEQAGSWSDDQIEDFECFVTDTGYTHYTYEGDGSYSNDDGDGDQKEKGYERTEYNSTVKYDFLDGHWSYASGTADYSEKWSDRWDYTVTDATGNIVTTGWDDAYEEYEEDYTLDTERGRWQMTNVGVLGDGEYGWLQTTTDPISYTAGGEHNGNDWEVEGTYKTNEGGGVEYAYWGTGEKVFDLWFYDGQGSVTSYTTSESSYSGEGEYGVDDEEVNGTVTAEGHDQFRFDSTTDYVLDLFGTWEVDQRRRATSGVGGSDWGYSATGTYESGYITDGNCSSGAGDHTSYDYRIVTDKTEGGWECNETDSYSLWSHGTSEHSSYSGSGSYSRSLDDGTIEGTVQEDGESQAETSYATHSSLNADGTWNDPTVTVKSTGNRSGNWSYSGDGTYDSDYLPSDYAGSIEEQGSEHFTDEWSTETGRREYTTWGSSEYSYSASGSDSWEDEASGHGTFSVDESGNGKYSHREQDVWRLSTGQGWTKVAERDFASGKSEASVTKDRFTQDGDEPDVWSTTDYHFDNQSTSELSLDTRSTRNASGILTPVGSFSDVTTSSGTCIVDGESGIYTGDPDVSYRKDEYGVGENGCREEESTTYHADGTQTSDPTCTNHVRGENTYNGTTPDYPYGYPYDTTVSTPGFLYTNDAFVSGTAPMSGYSGGLSHSFTMANPPAMMSMSGESGQTTLGMAASGATLLSAPAATSSLAATGLFAAPAASTGTAAGSGLLNLGFATFDAAGRVASVANANGSNTRFTYDGNGNLATVLDAVGNMTQWVYDAEGQVTEEINPLGDSRYYGYNEDGSLARYTDRNGRVRVYEYDDHQRVTAEIWYANAADADAAANPVNTIHFAYDDAGRITSEWDDLSSVTYVYTDSGLLAGTTQAHVGGPTVVLAYGFSDAGLRTSTVATIDGVADYVDEYAYDSQGRLVAIAQYGAAGGNGVADKQISLGYNDQGLLATVTRYTDGNLAVLAQYTYDSASRLTALVYSQRDTILASYAWTYGDTNSPLPLAGEGLGVRAESAFSWLPSGGLMPGQDTGAIVNALWEGTGTPASLITEITSLDGTVSYSYDSAGQLLGATYTTGQTGETYTYDAAGNRLTANGATYVTGTNNQLLFDGIYSYLYDPEGNRTARFIDVNANGLLDAGDTAATTYAWDHRNRLTRVTDYDLYGDPATRAVDYLYDTENRWIGRDVDLDADGQIDSQTRFAYDGNQIVLQFDRAVATAGAPADPLTLENLSHRYLWNPAAVDQLMADEHVTTPDTPGTILWPLADHLGTIRDLAAHDSSTGTTTVVNHRVYDSYGNLQSQTNAAVDCLFAFTGRPIDDVTGLQNNLHRWYDPAVGRWMSEDPIGFEGRDGNLSAYVGNGPVNAVDPSGLEVWVETTPSVGGWHRRITVHVRDENGDIVGTYSISYGRHHNLPKTQGIVYRDTDPTLRKTILMRYTTTPEQDAQILQLMRSIEGRTGAYHPIFPNCRTFSETLYWDIVRALVMTGKPPEITTFPLHPLPPGPRKPQAPPFPPLGSGSPSGGE